MRAKIYHQDDVLKMGHKFWLKHGLEKLTARKFAKENHISSQPIYDTFGSLSNFKDNIIAYGIECFNLELEKDNPENLLDLQLFILRYLCTNKGMLKTLLAEPEYSSHLYPVFKSSIKEVIRETNNKLSDKEIEHLVIKSLGNVLGLAQLVIFNIVDINAREEITAFLRL